ncbi:MAG: hypothetical protein IT449_05530 [Phycisphaerales bacterium]|nr:hypothetical protein [Phycisphaerales bacterium]
MPIILGNDCRCLLAALGAGLFAATPARAQDCPHREYAWTRTVGGEQGDYLLGGVAVDIYDNVLIAGEFEGKVDFDPGVGKDNRRPKGMGDAYVSWYHPDGAYGGTYTFGATRGAPYLFNLAFALDRRPQGGFVVGGVFNGKTDFNPTDGKDVRVPEGEDDAFIAAFKQDFSYDWTWTAGSNGYENIPAIAVDSAGSVYAAGTYSDHLWLGEGNERRKLVSNGDLDVFVIKLSASGELLWFTSFGGPDRDYPEAVAVEASGAILLVGTFREDVDFDPDGQHFVRISNGGDDLFVLKLTPDGHFDWAKTIGGERTDRAKVVMATSSGLTYVGGAFSGAVDFDPDGNGDVHDSSPASGHAFVTQYLGDGSYVWTRDFGGDASAVVTGLTTSANRLVQTGVYYGTIDLDPGPGIDERPPFGARSNYISYWALDGEYYLGDVFGGDGLDRTMGIAADSKGSVYVGGDFISDVVDFDPTAGVWDATNHGTVDVFLSKFECGQCSYVDRHDLDCDGTTLSSTVYTLAPNGRINVVLSSADREYRKSRNIAPDGLVSLRFKDLPAGDNTCSIRRLRNADGVELCSGEIAVRRILIP